MGEPGIQTEEWRPVVGHPDYEISDFGRVRSLDRVLSYTKDGVTIERKHRGKLLRPGRMTSGHMLVVLGRGNCRCVHALVLDAFVGPAPAGTECCHWDDNPANNHRGNLRWDTRSANMADFRRNYGHHQNQRPTHA